jgi:hypothetical protein
MMIRCDDFERWLVSDDPTDVEAARLHAVDCGRCSRTYEQWSELAAAARAMRREWDSPYLWTRIQSGIAPRITNRIWMPLTAAAAVLVLAAAAAWWMVRQPPISQSATAGHRLLGEQALQDVERAELDYVQSIERLSTLAAPALTSPPSALLTIHREKLLLLDAAIAECRAQVERNRFNTHLRRELLAMYQEKRKTLEEILNELKPAS